MNDTLILCYHAVSPSWPDDGAIDPPRLERQLRLLLDRGYRARTLSEALGRRSGEERTMAVTFDDAFASVHELGAPLLERLGIPATVFVPTDLAAGGELMTWSKLGCWRGTEHEQELRCMGWEQLRELCGQGWEVGAHSRSHPDLTTVGDEQLGEELSGSRAACEEALQRRCPAFAYPFGRHDDRVVAAVGSAGFATAVTIHSRLLSPLDDERLRLSREAIWRTDGAALFRAKVSRPLRRLRSVG